MSPVHSLSAPGSRIRRSRVLPTTVSLFPECPDDHSPKPGIAGRLTGDREAVFVTCDRKTVDEPVASNPGGSSSGCPTADCPPPSSASPDSQNRASGWTRDAAAAPHERANARLVGIARLAASSPPALTRRKSEERPEYFVLPVKSILNRCDSKRVPFEWTINIYRGCEFACKYCYARYTHEYMELDGGEFEKKIYVKKDAGPLLAWDVARKYSYASEASGGTRPEHIALGTATDPYQPAEREFGATRAILEQMALREGLSVSITTKSNQVVRDIDVLKRIAARSTVFVNVTVTTLRARLARLLEPRAPRPDLRLAAVKALRDAPPPPP